MGCSTFFPSSSSPLFTTSPSSSRSAQSALSLQPGSIIQTWPTGQLIKLLLLLVNSSLQVDDKYIWKRSEARADKKYMSYITSNMVMMGILPMILLSVLNWLIYRAISRAHALRASLKTSNAHRRDSTMATVLTAIVIVFVVCHTPKAALNMYEVCTVS